MSARTGALRRRRKRSLATRLRVLWVFIVCSVAAGAYGLYVLVTLPALRVHAVDVDIAGTRVSRGDVLRAARIDSRANVWLLPTAAIAQRIEALPYVDAADVRRVPPARLAIAVTQREPAACLRTGARRVLIDRSRRILQDGCDRARLLEIDVPPMALGAPGTVAAAPAAATLLADERVLAAAGVAIRALRHDRFGELVAVEPSGVQLLFGSDGDLAQKARLVDPVLAATRGGRPIAAVDLRAPGTPTVVYR